MDIKVIPFEQNHESHFRDLNVAWLKKYFHIEPKDKELLNNSKEVIIDTGGFIFMATYNMIVVGCFSFIKLASNHYELGKMAVDEKHQGLGIGQKLLKFALDFAEENAWQKITLYSSTKLPHALYLYKKYGFIEIELEKDLPYERSDIKMELILKNN